MRKQTLIKKIMSITHKQFLEKNPEKIGLAISAKYRTNGDKERKKIHL